MNKRHRIGAAIALGTAVLCLSGCTKSSDQTIMIHGNAIPTLYKATGEERKITGWGTSTDKGKTLHYGNGDVLSDDVVSYMTYLQHNDGYIVVDGSDDVNDSDVEKKMAVAKDAGDDHYYYVAVDWNKNGETSISYQYAAGTITPYDDNSVDSESLEDTSSVSSSFEEENKNHDTYIDSSSDFDTEDIETTATSENGYEYSHNFSDSNNMTDLTPIGSIVSTQNGKYIIYGYNQKDSSGIPYNYVGMKIPAGTQSLDYLDNSALFDDSDIETIYSYGYSGDEMTEYLNYLQNKANGADSQWVPSSDLPTLDSDGNYSDGGYKFHEGDIADTPIQSVVRLKDSVEKYMIIGTDENGEYLGVLYPSGYQGEGEFSTTTFTDSDIDEVYWYGVSADLLQ